MYNQLTDLDELLSKVKSRFSKEYLREAITSYRSGAYRAAVTSTWISICVDVIEKTRELALGGDAEAIKIEKRLGNITPNDFKSMLDFENDVLRIAYEDLGLISLIEKTHLERIKEDRNICAHPTFSLDGAQFIPPPEMVRSYIFQASAYLLNQPPIKGKSILGSIYSLITSESFPEESEKAFIVLKADQYLGRVKDSVYRNVTIILFKRLLKDTAPLSFSLMRKITSALSSIERLNSTEYVTTCREKLTDILSNTDDNNLKRFIVITSIKPDLWSYISEAIKKRVEQTIKVMEVTSLIEYRLTKASENIEDVKSYFISAIAGKTDDELKKLVQESPSPLLVNKAINIFVESGSFASAYNNGVNILLHHGEFIDDDGLKLVFEKSLSSSWRGINQILNAGGIGDVFAELYLKTKCKVLNHKKLWKDFWEELNEKGFEYPPLDALMTTDGLIIIDPVDA